jgi:polyisoprenoid-binding protein YceI
MKSAAGMLASAFLAVTLLGTAARADTPVTHYVSEDAKSVLEFAFSQAGAQNKGRFTRLPVKFDFSPDNLAGSRLEVTVEMNSLDTGDKERDDTLRGADLFAVAKYPQAHFLATQFAKTANGYEAIGKLTIRDATRDLRLPFAFRTASDGGANVAYMSGKTTLKRLDYGVGQGDWKATDQVGNDVVVSFNVRLIPAAH